MSNLQNSEQARIENKVQEVANDIRVKFPKPGTNSNISPLSNIPEITTLPEQKDKIKLNQNTVDPSSLYTTLPSGDRIQKYDNYIDGTNEDQRLANEQTTTNKWTNGLSKFVTKTGTSILGGTVGSLYGAIDAVKSGSVEAIWNNDFNNYLDDLNTQLDYKLPNYYTEQEKNAGFLESTGTANFWANDFLGGLSFTVGTIASEAILGGLTGGSSLITSGARVGARAANAFGKGLKTIKSVKDTSKGIKTATKLTKDFLKASALNTRKATNYGKAISALNTARFTYTSAGYESGVEARQYMKEQKELFNQNFVELNGRQPTFEERVEFNKNLDSSANTVFAANLALVGSSNLAILGKMYNIGSPVKAPSKWLNKKLFGVGVQKAESGAFEAIKRNTTQKVLGTGYSIFRAPVIEGIWEEGMQAVTSTSAASFLEAQYNNQKESIDLVEAMYEGLSHTYGTKQGWKEIGLGMLIGLVGGQASNVGTGQGLFSDVSNLKTRDTEEAKARNIYSSEKVVNEIVKSAVINKATKESQKAQERGDLTGENLSDSMAMMANIMMSDNFDYGEEAKQDLFTMTDLISDETLKDEFGVTEQVEIDEFKQNIKNNYENLQTSYKKNREFAEYQIGTQKGLVLPVESYKNALAYQLTMSEKVESLADDYLTEIKKEVLDFSGTNNDYSYALDLQNALLKTTTKKRAEYLNVKRNYKKAQQSLDLAEKRTQSIRNQILVREEAGDLAKKLDINNRRIQELQLELENKRNEIELFSDSIMLSSPFREQSDLVRPFDILDIDNILNDMQDNLQALKKTNPAKVAKLKRLTSEYKKAMYIYDRYGKIVNSLLNPELGVIGDSRTFLTKTKPLNEVTLDFLTSLQQASNEYNDIEKIFETTETQPEVSNKDDIGANITKDIVETTDPVDILKNKLKTLLADNSYLLEYFGEDFDSNKPTAQDVLDFEQLKNKYQDIDIDILINVNPENLSNTARGGLDIEEIKQYQIIAKKLGNWRLLDGIEENGISILDIVNQIDALENPVTQQNQVVSERTDSQEIDVALKAKEINKPEETDPSLFQTYDTVLVAQDNKNTQISHLSLSSFIKMGASIKENGTPVLNIESVQKKKGATFKVQFGDIVIPLTIGDHSRLLMTNEAFNNLLEATDIKAIDTTNVSGSRWTMLYQKQEDDSYKPLDSDFIIDPNESGFTTLSPEGTYNTEIGSTIFYKLSLNNKWNRDLQKEVIALDKSDPIKVGKLKEKIRRQILVYGTNENNQITGVLKAATDKTNDPVFLAIREKAASTLYNTAFDQANSETVFTLPYSTIVDRVYTGMANMTLEDNGQGQLKPKKTELTDRTIEMVESFGVARAGNVILNNNFPIGTEQINTSFIESLEGDIPVAIIKYQAQQIAYPITLKKKDSNLYEGVVSVLNSEQTNSKKVVEISNLLASQGINPKQYNLIQTGDISFIGSQDQAKLLEDIQKLEISLTSEEILDQNYTKDNLVSDGSMTINLENRPFLNPKIKVDYKSSIAEDIKTEEEIFFDKTGFVPQSVRLEIANQIILENTENLSQFQNKVLSLQSEQIDEIINQKLALDYSKEKEATKEKNKKC